jgi:hypothetical protein
MQLEPEFWEKTVEYAFVLAAAKAEKLDFAMPLAGKAERAAGDAIFGVGARLVLVEFKRNRGQIKSEKPLFHDYDAARVQLSSLDSHHHLVFPEWKAGSELVLHAETYFSSRARLSAVGCLSSSVDARIFREYLDLLFALKKKDGRSSSGQLSSMDMASVLGVSNDGKLVESVSLNDYAPDLFPEQELHNESTTEVQWNVPQPN